MLNKDYSCRDIAKVLKRSPNTISREIKENSVNGKYNPHKANHKACMKGKHSKYQGMKIILNDKLREYVKEKLKVRLVSRTNIWKVEMKIKSPSVLLEGLMYHKKERKI